MNKIGIFYKYNKYLPINGSLFYALEYYFTIFNNIQKINLDNDILEKEVNETEIDFYWVFPKKIINTKKNINDFKWKLLKLIAAKYPINFTWVEKKSSSKTKKSLCEILKILNLNKSDKSDLLEISRKLDQYFKKIKIISESNLIKLQVDKSLFISQNTVHDSILSDVLINFSKNFGEKYFICNRKFNSLTKKDQDKWEKISKLENCNFLYELPQQKLPFDCSQEQYNLKLGVEWFWKKEHIQKYKKYIKENNYLKRNNIMRTGQPSSEFLENLGNSFFSFDNKEYDNSFYLYMIWDSIHYYRREFEENNRAIIESNFYNIPFKIIGNDQPLSEHEQEQYIKSLNDSLQGRKENPNNYILTKDDKLINELLQ